MTWGELPEIKIVDDTVVTCGTVTSWYGCSRNKTEVELSLEQAVDLNDPKSKRTMGSNKRGGRVYIVGVKLLHELCHWGYQVAGVAEAPGFHAGDAFEIAAYGQVVHIS